MTSLPRLYAVADRTYGDPLQLSRSLFEGGVRLVQIRDKKASAQKLLAETEEILKFVPTEARVVVNDRCDVARLSGAAGVHLGQTDLSPAFARLALMKGQFVGYSTHSLSQALEADVEPVDYIAVGPIFPTMTKENPAPVVGLEGLREICARVRKPVVAIGGITLESSQDVLDCGASSLAVIGDLYRHGDVTLRTREWVRRLER